MPLKYFHICLFFIIEIYFHIHLRPSTRILCHILFILSETNTTSEVTAC